MSFKKKIYLKYITCIIHTWFLSKTNSIKHDTLTDNVNMVCPSTFETFQGSFVNRIAAYSFDTQNGNYQMEGFIKSIDLSPSNLPNNSFNSSNGNGYIYAVGNGNNKLLISLTGNSYTDIENFDILISMAYEIKNGSYNLTLTSYHENSSPYYVQITNSSSYMWHIYNARFPVNGSFILNIYGSGFGRLDDICLFQVCSEGYAFDYSVDKCKATSLQPFNTTTMQSLITKATEALTATTTKDLIISMTYRLVENIATPLVNGKILAVLPSIEKEYLVSFDFYPNSIPNDMFYAVIRLTNTTGINYASNGYHIPGIYLFSSGYLQIASSLNGNGFGFFNTYPISVKEWINIEISQILICEDYVYRIKLNGNYVYLQINHQSQRFKNVTVYASDFSWPTDGLIKNLYVSTGNATTLTEPPNTVAMKSTTITTVKAPTTTSSTDAPTTSKTINFITTTDDPIISTFYWLVKNFATPLVNGKILTVLSSIEKEYLVSFEFYPNSFPPNGFYSIIRFTNISESDDIEYNVSSVYLHSSGSLLIASSMNGDGFRYFNTDAIILKNWIIIEISQVLKCGQYVYTIKLNGVVVYVELNYQSQRFNKIRVYAADITLPTDGYIKNLYVFNGNTNPCYYKNCYTSSYCSVVSGIAVCSCPNGFKLQSDTTTCVHDPCYYKNCYNSNYCSVVSGVAMCSCPIGFKLQPDSTICVQDPCYYKNCYSSNYCRVMSGYAVCSCPIGLKLQSDGITCVQDPCYYKNCYNLTYCSVVSSVAMCSCPIGFKLQSDGTTCVQDPCHYKNCNTSNFCIVVSGIAVCSCPNGLKLQPDGISCVEDPCYFKNCYTLSYCNVVSGYAVCSCPNGFKLQSDGITCVLDPCYYKNCYNLYYCSVVSGYAVCSCPIGFKLQPDNITCVQDPCYYKNCYNTTYCSVVSGVAMCSCPIGFKLQSDNTTCVQDPCYYKSCYTSNYCSIVSGYAMCSCPIGFKLQFDNITCIQDPCYYKNCYTSNYCSVVSGFAVCFCPNGFNLQSDNITCVKASLFSIELFNSKTAVIVIATLGVVLFVFIVIFAVTVVLFKKKKKSQLPMANAFLQTIEYNNQVTSHETIADEWEIYPECFLIDKKIGGGAYSTVFMVKINAKILSKTKHANRSIASLPALNKNCRSNVAVKFLKAGASQLEINDFKEEINIMKKIGYHHNILNMLGCSTVKKPLCLVTEYMENGDLLQFLCDRRTTLQVQNDESIVYASTYQRSLERPITTNSTTEAIYHDILLEDVEKITPRDLLSFAYQVASGMEYLSKINVVHRNLSASNILVGAKKNVKISDFGLSRKIQNESQYIGNKIRHVPIKWMSIEALLDLVFMSYSDVWAFGVVLFEIVTLGGTPYPTISNHKLLGFLKSGCRMDRPENCSTIIYNIMLHCWSEDPLQRPTFSELRNHLEELLLQGGFYFSFDINENNVYYNATSFNHLPSETGNGSHEVERIRNAHITV
nr:uncharacterized protein LOC105845628 isoform X13 [Hydra vulgaris]